jgi:hypothetical protein
VSTSFGVAGTQSRPAGLRLFTLAHNNLNPSVVAEDDALIVRVIQRNRLPWSRITKVVRSRGMFTEVVAVTCEGWEYLMHFHSKDEAERLMARLRDAGVAT